MTEEPAFELLHPSVQRQLWEMRWTHLRPGQASAIRAIIGTRDHLVLAGPTASGKTEAAFLPILSLLAEDSAQGVLALYVGPLKALINDQFTRVGDLCAHLGLAVHHWHGDVPAAEKRRLIARPSGILLTTPESLESMFVNRAPSLAKLFAELRFVVLDELHTFLSNERGLQLRSLLKRLTRLQSPNNLFRMIGLSATIGDAVVAKKYVQLDDSQTAAFIQDNSATSELRLRVHAYREAQSFDDSDRIETLRSIATDVVKHCRGNANLVFANAKTDVEELADLAIQIGGELNLPDRFMVHHGSLSSETREEAETVMKSGVPATTFCSSTLEMGIDIGSVKLVGQVGAPWSVSSTQQRLGRGGRREGEPRILRMYIRCRQADTKSTLFDRLNLELIQAIAVIELMLKDWLEPPAAPMCDLSTLTQQMISVISQRGAETAANLHNQLCACGAFADIEKALFKKLIRQLVDGDILELTPEGHLILGLKGEKIRKDKGFYAVFVTPEEFTVLHAGQRIGAIATAPQINEHFLLGGRRWQVTAIEHERLEIFVQPAHGRRPPRFSSGGGEIHAEIRREMKAILSSSKSYAYLDSTGTQLLSESRMAANSARICDHQVIQLGPMNCALMTWTGSRIQATLQALLTTDRARPADEDIALLFKCRPDEVKTLLQRVKNSGTLNAVDIASRSESNHRRKYDWALGDELRIEQAARAFIDMPGAINLLGTLLES
jgi:ATP-dependent Lhr-like helicase